MFLISKKANSHKIKIKMKEKRRLWQPAEGNWPDYIFISVLVVVCVCMFVCCSYFILFFLMFFLVCQETAGECNQFVCGVGVGWSFLLLLLVPTEKWLIMNNFFFAYTFIHLIVVFGWMMDLDLWWRSTNDESLQSKGM